MRIAPFELANLFSTERSGDLQTSFGYHGVWNMPRAIGVEAFWRVYRELDDRGTVSHDFSSILNDVRHGRGGQLRMVRMIADHIKYRFGRAKGDSLNSSKPSDRKA